MKKILIIGATSALATATARCFAREGAALHLAARNHENLERLAGDLRTRGAQHVSTSTFDALNPSSHAELVRHAAEQLGGIDGALIAHGTLPSQELCQTQWATTEQALVVNLMSPIALLTELATYFETRKKGNITAISSVAGDRGRQSNYVYGAAKGGLSIFLQGLRNRLAHHGVSVTTIKPGFVDTPMTAHLPKGPLFASPERVGARIHKAMKRGESVVYTPWFWRFIMGIIVCIPEFIFKKLRL
jgi:short-subunit dehydrogenase